MGFQASASQDGLSLHFSQVVAEFARIQTAVSSCRNSGEFRNESRRAGMASLSVGEKCGLEANPAQRKKE
jgi:hypothetical protein